MKITLIDGQPNDAHVSFEAQLGALAGLCSERGHEVTRFTLRELEIRPCIGCWSCWWKTPGLCGTPDDTHALRRSYLHADRVLIATPLIMGFPSALTKTVIDKLIPLFHPYIELADGECIHQARYDRYPTLATLLQPGPDDEDEDLHIVERYFERFAWHFRSPLLFQHTVDQPMEVVADALEREVPRVAGGPR